MNSLVESSHTRPPNEPSQQEKFSMSLPEHLKIQIEFFTFPDHTKPAGLLPHDKGAQACWYFYVLAQKQKEKVGESIDDQFGLLEGDMWMDKRYEQTARTVAMLYQLESPDDFLKYFDVVAQEAQRCDLPIPTADYTKPLRRIILS
jgi:hypothetical protein